MNEAINGSYKVETNRQKKNFLCIVEGKFSGREAKAYIAEIKHLVSTIRDIEEYTLIVDASKQQVVDREVLPLLKELADIYMQTPFKSRRYIRPEDAKANDQVLCMAGQEFLDAFEVEPSDVIIHEEANNLNVQDIERKTIIHLCKMDKNELLTVRAILGTMFDIAILKK